MKANNFKFESATLTYEGNRKCPQIFILTGATTVSEVLAEILKSCGKNKYNNKLDVCLSYGGVEMVLSIDFDNNKEVYVLTDKDVRLPLTEKTDMFVVAGMRTYICHMSKDGEFEWNEHAEEVKEAEKVKVSKFNNQCTGIL